jgi:hypothetical protein
MTSLMADRALLCAVPVFVMFLLLGRWEQGIGAWICTAIVFLVVGVRWELRHYSWFWIAIAVGILIQAPFVLLVPWKDRNLTWLALTPVGVLDYFLVYFCVRAAEKLKGESSPL